MTSPVLLAILVITIVILLSYTKENFENYYPADSDNWIRLYETFTFAPNPPDARWWEFAANSESRIKKDLKMNLKSYDIKVKRGLVQLWAVYPGEVVASSSALGISGFGSAYTDAAPLMPGAVDPGWQHKYTTSGFGANDAKYKLIAEAKDGDHLRGTLDYKVTRLIVVANFY